ncbi:MAG: ABC transporter substrate-binding protein, partial [Omnitrophica bacterium]|nr:ABC transporter substrate-binding protein [Candidatus Omnitrophota bacterium]
MGKKKENLENIAQNLTLVNCSAFEQKTKVFLLTLSILLFSACVQEPKEAKLEKITIAFQEWVGYGLFYLGQERGFFKEEGIELIFVDEKLDSARRDAFKSGILDCEGGTIDLLIAKRAQSTPIVSVLELDHSAGSDAIVATKDIQKLEDLIGKRVALARDDVGETFISYLFYKKKLLLDDVIIIPARPE